MDERAAQLETFAVEQLSLSHYRAAILVAIFRQLSQIKFTPKIVSKWAKLTQ